MDFELNRQIYKPIKKGFRDFLEVIVLNLKHSNSSLNLLTNNFLDAERFKIPPGSSALSLEHLII